MPEGQDTAERLAHTLLGLINVPSESLHEDAIASHVLELLGGRAVDAGDNCVLAGVTERSADRPLVLLAGHLDTVPEQGNMPASRDGDTISGLGASDMKAALAVMIDLILHPAPDPVVDVGAVFFPREELPFGDTALTPLLQRRPELLTADLAIVMEPTALEVQLGCLGNLNATWTFTGTAGHSARPWLADNAIAKAAAAVADLAGDQPVEQQFGGLTFREVTSAVMIEGGVARNVIPDSCVVTLNHRYGPGTTASEAEARLHARCEPAGSLNIDGNAPSGAVPATGPLIERLTELSGASPSAKQAWTPVAEFSLAGVDAVNFGPGDPKQAHRRDESASIAAMVTARETLSALLCG